MDEQDQVPLLPSGNTEGISDAPTAPTNAQIKKSWKNLRPWKPGQSGNLGGRPKRKPMTEAIEWMLDMPYPPTQRKLLETKLGIKLRPDVTFAQIIALGAGLRGVGETATAAWITDRVEGMLKQSMDLDLMGKGPLLAPILISQYVEIAQNGGEPIKITDVTKTLTVHPQEPLPKNGNGNGTHPTTDNDPGPESI